MLPIHLISEPYEFSAIIGPILQIKNLKLRNVKLHNFTQLQSGKIIIQTNAGLPTPSLSFSF